MYLKKPEKYREDADWNFRVGRKNHSPKILEKYYRALFMKISFERGFSKMGKIVDFIPGIQKRG